MAYYFVLCFLGCKFILHHPFTLEYCDYQMGNVWCTINLSFMRCTNYRWDIKHKLHGLAFLLGVPSLPIAALLVSYHLINKDNWKKYKSPILFSAHFTWISLVLMAVSMVLMISGFQKAGIPIGEGIGSAKICSGWCYCIKWLCQQDFYFCLHLLANTYCKNVSEN